MRTLILAVILSTTVVVQPSHEKAFKAGDRVVEASVLSVHAVPDQCANALALELWHKSSQPIPHGSDQPQEFGWSGTPLLGEAAPAHVWFTRVKRDTIGTACQWTFSDLPAGDYVALLVRPEGSGGSQEVTISGGTNQTIEIPAPTLTTSGVIAINGQPQAYALVRMRDQPWTRPTVTVTADAFGYYTAMLDRPAMYAISANAPVGMGAARVAALHEGTNELDIPVFGYRTVLEVDVMSTEGTFRRTITEGLSLRVERERALGLSHPGWSVSVTAPNDDARNLLYRSLYLNAPHPSQLLAWHFADSQYWGADVPRILPVYGHPVELRVDCVRCRVTGTDSRSEFTAGMLEVGVRRQTDVNPQQIR